MHACGPHRSFDVVTVPFSQQAHRAFHTAVNTSLVSLLLHVLPSLLSPTFAFHSRWVWRPRHRR